MRAIVGVDAAGTYRPAIDLLAKLAFEKSDVELVHVAERRQQRPVRHDQRSPFNSLLRAGTVREAPRTPKRREKSGAGIP